MKASRSAKVTQHLKQASCIPSPNLLNLVNHKPSKVMLLKLLRVKARPDGKLPEARSSARNIKILTPRAWHKYSRTCVERRPPNWGIEVLERRTRLNQIIAVLLGFVSRENINSWTCNPWCNRQRHIFEHVRNGKTFRTVKQSSNVQQDINRHRDKLWNWPSWKHLIIFNIFCRQRWVENEKDCRGARWHFGS